jgi:hypothetical protein
MSRKTGAYDVASGFCDEAFDKRPLLPNLPPLPKASAFVHSTTAGQDDGTSGVRLKF